MTKIYVATSLAKEFWEENKKVVNYLRSLGQFDVYYPLEGKVPDKKSMTNVEWGQYVFEMDKRAIDSADFVVMLSRGRWSTAGTNWEVGYCYGVGKKVVVVEMNDTPQSLMISNGSHAVIKGLEGLKNYNFKTMPKTMTETAQA